MPTTNVQGLGTFHNLPNYSGMLATASVTQTPFLSMTLSRPMRTVRHLQFTTMSDYTLPTPSADGISENAAADIRTNVTATNIVRGQRLNYIQTFVDKVSISYIKQATSDAMAGLNDASQGNNAPSELAFQRSMVIKKNARNMEYAFLNGKAHMATTANDPSTTGGIIEAVLPENTLYTGSTDVESLDRDAFEGTLKKMYDNGAYLENIFVFANSSLRQRITRVYEELNGFGLPATRTESGVSIVQILTDFATVNVVLNPFMPTDKVLFADMNYVRAVGLNTKLGNFYFEWLGTAGAAYEEMFYGNIGLDYGPDFVHGLLVTGEKPATP